MDKNELIKAFHTTWDNYPGGVFLLSRKHEIVALNKKAVALGCQENVPCFSLNGNSKVCRWCKASKAMKTGEPVREVTYVKERNTVYDSFWIPISDEYFIHFGNDITPYANIETLIPA